MRESIFAGVLVTFALIWEPRGPRARDSLNRKRGFSLVTKKGPLFLKSFCRAIFFGRAPKASKTYIHVESHRFVWLVIGIKRNIRLCLLCVWSDKRARLIVCVIAAALVFNLRRTSSLTNICVNTSLCLIAWCCRSPRASAPLYAGRVALSTTAVGARS